MLKNTIEAQLTLSGTFDPNELSERIGLKATSTHRKGENMAPLKKYSHDIWCFTDEQKNIYDINDIFDALRDRLEGYTEAIHQACSGIDCKAILVILVYREDGNTPVLFIDSTHLAWLVQMDCAVEIDIIY